MPPVYRNEEDARSMEDAVRNGEENAAWGILINDGRILRNSSVFFGDRSKEFFDHLGQETMHKTMGRTASRTSYAKLFMLSQGCSVADLISPDKKAEDYLAAGEAAVRFLQDNPLKGEMGYEDRKKASAVYGTMFHSAADRLMEEEIPTADWQDPAAVAGVFRYFDIAGDLSIDYSQIKERDLTYEDGFLEAYGGERTLNKMDHQIGLLGLFSQVVREAYDPEKPEATQIGARMALKRFGDEYGGKKVGQLPDTIDKAMEFQSYFISAQTWYVTAKPEERDGIKAYLNGTGPEPPYILDKLERTVNETVSLRKRTGEEKRLTDEDLHTREHGSVEMLRLFNDGPGQASRYFKLRQQGGKLRVGEKDSQAVKQEKENLIQEGAFCFETLSRQMNLQVDHPVYQNAGYNYVEELLFIDGVPATEYMKQRYPDFDIKSSEKNRQLLRAEVVSALLSGEHHVEAAQLGIGKNGAYEVNVREIRADARIMDGQERFYQTRPSKKQEKFYADDKKRDQRLDGIRTQVSERLAKAAGEMINRQEAEKGPYAAAAKKFSFGSAQLNQQYFDWKTLSKLSSIPRSATAELPRGDFGGYRTYAQMLLLAENPQIRFADLTNPDKFVSEKKEAGARVAEAFSRLYAGPPADHPEDKTYLQPAAEIMKKSMKAVGELDVRRELLYALELPQDLSEEAARDALNRPENLPGVSGFLSAVSSFSVNGFQALGRVVNGTNQSVAQLDPAQKDSYKPVYSALAEMLDEETRQRYRSAERFTRALNVEKRWNAVAAASAGSGEKFHEDTLNEAIAFRAVGDLLREEIIHYGKAADVPEPDKLMELSGLTNPGFRAIVERVGNERRNGNPKYSVEYLRDHGVDRRELEQLRSHMQQRAAEARPERTTVSFKELAEMENTGRKKPFRQVPVERKVREQEAVDTARREKSEGMRK